MKSWVWTAYHGTGTLVCTEAGLWEVVVAASNSAHRQHSSTGNTPLTEHCRGQEKGGACWLTSLRWARAFHLLGDVSLKV